MKERYCRPSTVQIQMDSSDSGQASAPPPYSDISDAGSTGENKAKKSPTLSKLLDKQNVFQITTEDISEQVLDGSGTVLLSILRQPVFGMDWRIQNLFLNSTGKPVMEMTRIIDDKDAPVLNKTWTVYEGGRVAGILRHLDGSDKRELVGYRISGKEMFRAVEQAPYTLTMRGDGKDLAVITTGDNRISTSLAIFNQDVELELKALLLCSALYYHCVSRHPVIPDPDYLSGGREIVQRSQRSTWTNKIGTKRSICIRGALDTTIRVFVVIILAILILLLPFVLIKELS